jgi:acyl-CoA thioester hydrolase
VDGLCTNLQLRIDWSDLDAFGHVNNLAILRYAQTARVHLLEEIGMMQAQAEEGIGPVLASTNCQFRKQLFYPGQVSVHTRIEQVKNTSFHLRHRILDDGQDLIAESHDVLVMIDFRSNAKLGIPQVFRDRMGAGMALAAEALG